MLFSADAPNEYEGELDMSYIVLLSSFVRHHLRYKVFVCGIGLLGFVKLNLLRNKTTQLVWKNFATSSDRLVESFPNANIQM